MKKFLSVLAALVLMLPLACAATDLAALEGVKEEQPAAFSPYNYLRNNLDVRQSATIPLSEDVVVIQSDGSYQITTQGITCTLMMPFGWFVFTQDFLGQLDLFVNTFNDPLAVYSEMLNEGTHLFAINSELNGNYVKMIVYQDSFSKLFGSLNNQSSEVLSAYLAVFARSFPGSNVEIVKTGGHPFLMVRESSGTYETLFAESIEGDYNVRIIMFSSGATISEEEKADFLDIIDGIKLI